MQLAKADFIVEFDTPAQALTVGHWTEAESDRIGVVIPIPNEVIGILDIGQRLTDGLLLFHIVPLATGVVGEGDLQAIPGGLTSKSVAKRQVDLFKPLGLTGLKAVALALPHAVPEHERPPSEGPEFHGDFLL